MIEGASRLNQIKIYYFAEKLAEIANLNSKGSNILNLGVGSPDMQPPKEVIEELSKGLYSDKAHQYQSYYGLRELREAFSHFYKTHFQVNINADNEVLPLIGSKEGIRHISMSFLDKGDQVLIPNPGYPSYKTAAQLAGAKAIAYELDQKDNWLPNLQELQSQDLSKVKLMWVNYPHMPTGARATKTCFQDLVDFGLKNNILICHDNPYAFILNDSPLSIMSADNAIDTALELTSLSKCFNMAGCRVGSVVANSKYISTIVKFKSNMDSGMFKPIQIAATKALSLGDLWFNDLNEAYEKRRKIAWQIFDTLQLEYRKDSSGLFVWAKSTDSNGSDISDLILEQAKVFITPGFVFGTKGTDYLRISLCSPIPVLKEALERIISIVS